MVKVIQKPICDIDGSCNGGWAKWEQNEIIIGSDLPQDRKEQVFIHEIVHFINISFSEETTAYLSECIYQILVENNMLK